MLLTDIITRDDVIPDLNASNKEEAIREFAEFFVKRGKYSDESKIFLSLYQREKLGSTGIGGGVAIPHGKLPDINDVIGIFARSKKGIDFDSLDGKPVHLFFVLLAPEGSPGKHLRVMAKISKMVKDSKFKERLLKCSDEEVFEVLREQDEKIS